jgi:hypothetical protein
VKTQLKGLNLLKQFQAEWKTIYLLETFHIIKETNWVISMNIF